MVVLTENAPSSTMKTPHNTRMEPSSLQIHQLQNLPEFSEVVALQQEIWGFQDVELLPRRLFVVASKIGGQVLGAYDRDKLVAFCLCIPGLKPGGRSYLYSHMLGVLGPYRNTGLGRRLKLAQREFALEAGVDLIEWTFDPLELKNAFFNIEKLGAVVRRFVHNQYGKTSSHLHGGLPTDRLIAEWHLRSSRAVDALGKMDPARRSEGNETVRIDVPADIAEIRSKDPERARAVQAAIGAKFDDYFAQGLAVTGFERTGEFGTYVLNRWESN
jgi:predicted GNAT superfamily acetyltransferase